MLGCEAAAYTAEGVHMHTQYLRLCADVRKIRMIEILDMHSICSLLHILTLPFLPHEGACAAHADMA